MTLPRFKTNFRERTQQAWSAFAEIEAELRAIMDADKLRERGEELMEKLSQALEPAFSSPAFEIGYNGKKYELILSAEGNRSALFPLVYFRKHAPKEVLAHWNILVGRQSQGDFSLRTGGMEVKPEDVQVWVEQQEDGRLSLSLYCEKLLSLQQEENERTWWMLSTLTDQVLGEINSIAHIETFDFIDAPQAGPFVSLAKLPQMLTNLGLTDYRDGSEYLENSYLAYELEPVEDPDADWRLDTYVGSTRLPVIINDYLGAHSDVMDEYHKDGIVAGFLCYPVEGFEGKNQADRFYDSGTACKLPFWNTPVQMPLPSWARHRIVLWVSGFYCLGFARRTGCSQRFLDRLRGKSRCVPCLPSGCKCCPPVGEGS